MDVSLAPRSELEISAAKVAALLNPRNVVILGATDRPGNWPQRVWRNLQRYKFPGAVYPLNPNRDQVWDTRCYKSFSELPEQPDHVVVLIPAAFVPDALRQAAAAGARSATIMTSGFSEATDAASQKLAASLEAVIAETGLAVSGPNCLGNLNAGSSLMTMPDDRPQIVAAGPVAIVGQSGGLAMAIKRTLEERGVNSHCVVTSGNEAGLTTADYIAYFAAQPETRVIVSYLESVKQPAAFLDACRAARARGKPVVLVKLGASDDGRAAALAHTGALAGSMEAFDAVAGAAGAIRVRTLDDIVEIVEFFVHAPLPKGSGLGGITFSGGLRGLLLDAASANGLRFVTLAPKTLKRLQQLLTVGTIIGNPLDSGFAALTSAQAYIECVAALLGDPGVDVLLLQEELPRGPGTERKEANLRAVNELAARVGKPVSFVTMISHGLTDYSRSLRADLPKIAFLQEVDKTLRAVRSVTDYAARARAKPRKIAASPAAARQKLDKLLGARKSGPLTLSEVDSKTLLKAYGIPCPKEKVATSAKEAAEIAARIGFPVVAKAVSAALPHKSDAGGVKLNLSSAKEVRAAYDEIVRKIGKRAKLDGVLIAEMVSGGLELVLGANRDPEIGPVILFGTGGIDLELLRDVALAPPPLDEQAAEELIARTRAGTLIAGYRGKPALDKKALVKALVGLSQLVVDAGERIESIDINPFVLKRRGGVALDGLVVLGKVEEAS